MLSKGFERYLENGEKYEESNFYYCEHQPATENKFKILEVDRDNLLIKLTAKTENINLGDTPPNKYLLSLSFLNYNSMKFV